MLISELDVIVNKIDDIVDLELLRWFCSKKIADLQVEKDVATSGSHIWTYGDFLKRNVRSKK